MTKSLKTRKPQLPCRSRDHNASSGGVLLPDCTSPPKEQCPTACHPQWHEVSTVNFMCLPPSPQMSEPCGRADAVSHNKTPVFKWLVWWFSDTNKFHTITVSNYWFLRWMSANVLGKPVLPSMILKWALLGFPLFDYSNFKLYIYLIICLSNICLLLVTLYCKINALWLPIPYVLK